MVFDDIIMSCYLQLFLRVGTLGKCLNFVLAVESCIVDCKVFSYCRATLKNKVQMWVKNTMMLLSLPCPIILEVH